MARQHTYYPRDLAASESVILPQFGRPGRTVQIEHRLVPASDHVGVGWPMVVRIDDDAQPAGSEDRRQSSIVSEFPSTWVFRNEAERQLPLILAV